MATKQELIWQKVNKYKNGSKRRKSEIIDDLVDLTGYSRKHLARLLTLFGTSQRFLDKKGLLEVKTARPGKRKSGGGRKAKYDSTVYQELIKLWVRFEFPCGKILAAILHDPVCLAASPKRLYEKLSIISPATIDRLLKKEKASYALGKGRSYTRQSPLLASIPVRTCGDWHDVGIGYLQIDHVGHDGGSTAGEFAFTLTTTDVKSGWTLLYGLLNKAQKWTFEALVSAARDYPFPILEFHPDNDSSFINYHLTRWCKANDINLTRSRAWKKNDNNLVEQKNDAVVRRYVGYLRYEGEEAVAMLNDLYGAINLMVNHFIPQRRLIKKERIGAKVRKHYDIPKTPYRRLMEMPDEEFPKEAKLAIQTIHQSLDPLALSRRIKDIQKRLIQGVISGTKLF